MATHVPIHAGFESLPASATIIPSADYSATAQTSDAYSTVGATAIWVHVNLSAFTGTNVVFRIEGYDEGTGTWNVLLAGTALTGAGAQDLIIDPRIAASAGKVAQQPIPHKFRVKAVYTAVTAATYSVSATLAH